MLPSYLQQQVNLYKLEQVRQKTAQTKAERLRSNCSGVLDFTTCTKPNYQVNWHHAVLCRYLDRWARKELKRLMVFMPPRTGKSEQVSRRLPAYLFGINPNARLMAASYGADLASLMNRDVQRIMDSPAYHELFPRTRLFGRSVRSDAHGHYLRNNDVFEIVNFEGSYRSSGVGGPLTGMGFDYGIIDDPIKNPKEAASPTFRKMLWEWYTQVFYERQEKDGCILLTMTRWHEDDLAGRLLKLAAEDPDADQWEVLRFPAIADGELHPEDPRQAGEPLWPEKYGLKWLASTRRNIGEYAWNAKQQQNPKQQEGNRFKRHWFKLVDKAPFHAQRVRYWDKAGTEAGGAYTAGVLLAQANNMTYVEDVVRGQWSAGQREAVMKQTAELDAQRVGNRFDVEIYIEQEPGSGGKESADSTVRNLSGYVVYKDRPTGDKDTRLEPFAVQAENDNVRLVTGTWNAEYIDEMCAIPFSTYRDQGDATAGAFNQLAAGREVSMETAPEKLGDWRG